MIVRLNYSIPGFRVKRALAHRGWLRKVLEAEGHTDGEINIVFVNDAEILRINREFLKHNSVTDVITFDYSDSGYLIGEIYISIDTVRANAVLYNVTEISETRRVMVHGILHLCGFDDLSSSEAMEMRKSEDAYLKKYVNEFQI